MTNRTEPGDCQAGGPNTLELAGGFAEEIDESKIKKQTSGMSATTSTPVNKDLSAQT